MKKKIYFIFLIFLYTGIMISYIIQKKIDSIVFLDLLIIICLCFLCQKKEIFYNYKYCGIFLLIGLLSPYLNIADNILVQQEFHQLPNSIKAKYISINKIRHMNYQKIIRFCSYSKKYFKHIVAAITGDADLLRPYYHKNSIVLLDIILYYYLYPYIFIYISKLMPGIPVSVINLSHFNIEPYISVITNILMISFYGLAFTKSSIYKTLIISLVYILPLSRNIISILFSVVLCLFPYIVHSVTFYILFFTIFIANYKNKFDINLISFLFTRQFYIVSFLFNSLLFRIAAIMIFLIFLCFILDLHTFIPIIEKCIQLADNSMLVLKNNLPSIEIKINNISLKLYVYSILLFLITNNYLYTYIGFFNILIRSILS